MRILIKIGVAILSLIVLGLAGLIGFPFMPVVQDQFGAGPYRSWLSEQRTDIVLTQSDGSFALGTPVYQSRFVILSEIHGYRAVQALDLVLMRHLVEQGPARTYLAELGPEQAMAFNLYLATGDDGPARAVFDAWATGQAQWANQEFFAKLGAMRALNDTLPAERQIWFVGVDNPSNLVQLQSFMERFSEGVDPGFGGYEGVQALNAALGEEALAREAEAGRYAHILPNIEQVAALDPDQHFYGLWGLFHGTKTTVNGAEPLAMRLDREGGAFEGEVSTLTTVCIDGCLNMMPTRALPAFLAGDAGADYVALPMNFDDVMLNRVRGINDVSAVIGDARLAAFQINAAGSPYHDGPRLSAQSGYLSLLQSFEYGGPAAEVTDYFIVMRGSAPLTPWAGTIHDVSGAMGEVGIEGVSEVLTFAPE